jgi:osmoprotectant transport system substrate-binding protein
MRTSRTLALGAASLALLVSACSSGGGGSSVGASASTAAKPTVTVGSAGFYEAALVAEIYAQALEANGYPVERKLELGERPVVQSALTSGEVNLVAEYLGGLGSHLGVEVSSDANATLEALREALAEQDLVALDYSPGTDADGFVVRSETAEDLGLETMSDLAEVADELVFGIAPGCPDNPVCGPGLNEVYGIDIEAIETETLAPCSTEIAEALDNGAIDVAQVCTTQPDIVRFNFVLLEDDKGLQPAQNLVPVASQELVDAAPDDFEETLNAVSAELTTEELTELGVQVAVEQVSFEDAAREWLEEKGLN